MSAALRGQFLRFRGITIRHRHKINRRMAGGHDRPQSTNPPGPDYRNPYRFLMHYL